MNFSSGWTRRQISNLADRYPSLTCALIFFFLFTVSNHVEYTLGMTLRVSPFWHMIIEGAIMSGFAALLLYEVIRLHRELAEVRVVRAVVSTLSHEINNPLQVVLLNAERLHAEQRYDETALRDIHASGERIRDAVSKLASLSEKIEMQRDPGFAGLIDVAGSR